MKPRLYQVLQHPFATLLPWAGIALVLLFILSVVHEIGVAGTESKRDGLEREWTSARQQLMRHREAWRAMKDLSQVWALLPDERDFAPLALGISEEAKRDRVTLPALSYKTEPTSVANTSK